jgi:hypothetical protein
MNTAPQYPDQPRVDQTVARDAAYWAKLVPTLKVGEVPAEALNLNVTGRRAAGPIQGFGQMWQRIYRIHLATAATPVEVIRVWKERFATFWPERNWFYGPLTGIAPGDVALLNLTMPGGLRLSTGVLVLYADEECFTLMTPEGHQFAGWITFSALEEEGVTVAQAHVLVRTSDPLYELGFMVGFSRMEDRFWAHTLRSLAAHFGVEGEVQRTAVRLDRKRQWSKAGNIRYNAFIRSALYATAAPVRRLSKTVRRRHTP